MPISRSIFDPIKKLRSELKMSTQNKHKARLKKYLPIVPA